MIDILEAYRFVWTELHKKPTFWFGIAAAAVITANIGIKVPQIGGIFIFILAVGLLNLSLRAVHKLNYGIADLVVQPETYLEICISITFLATYFVAIVMAENFFVANISLMLGTLLEFSFLKAGKFVLAFALLGWFILKIAFVPYYIIDRKLGAAASIVESWRDSNMIKLKVFLAVLLISLPFYVLKSVMVWTIDISLMIELLQALVVGHLWVKYMNYKAQVIRDSGKQNYRLPSQALTKRVYTYFSACIAVCVTLILF